MTNAESIAAAEKLWKEVIQYRCEKGMSFDNDEMPQVLMVSTAAIFLLTGQVDEVRQSVNQFEDLIIRWRQDGVFDK